MNAAPATPAAMRAHILERLVGETGDPDRLAEAARGLATRALPAITAGLNQEAGFPLDVEIADIGLGRIAEAAPQPDSFDALVVAGSQISPDAFVLRLDAAAIALLVGALFGADPEQPPAALERAPTPIELDVASMVMRGFAEALNGDGERALNLKLPVPRAVAGPDAARTVLRDGPAVRIAFRIAGKSGSGLLTLTMPQRLFLKARGEGGAANERNLAAQAEWHARFGGEVMRAGVKLTASVPMARMTLGEIAGLSVGQVIELPRGAAAETRLDARGKTVFLCEFGRLGENYTVRIRQPFDAEKEFIEGLVS